MTTRRRIPSISFISIGPGTQVLVMRGASDGSNPNYANTSATGFFVDDMSVSWFGVQPDLHLYDIERIEVLNGPQGTTFGAGSMSGAIRYITNKPDVNAFSAGVDFDAGQIQDGQQNWTYEGFVNVPIIEGMLGFRASAFSDSHGGFINNQLTTRTWVNTAGLQQCRLGAQRLQPRARRRRARGLEGACSTSDGARRSPTTISASPPSAPGTRIRRCRRARSSASVPESHDFEAKTLDFHVDGDVGIGDLVFASTYWSLPTRQQNEYSQYMQNFNGGANERRHLPE